MSAFGPTVLGAVTIAAVLAVAWRGSGWLARRFGMRGTLDAMDRVIACALVLVAGLGVASFLIASYGLGVAILDVAR